MLRLLMKPSPFMSVICDHAINKYFEKVVLIYELDLVKELAYEDNIRNLLPSNKFLIL
jgi:ferredoxin--NADP+ reductase